MILGGAGDDVDAVKNMILDLYVCFSFDRLDLADKRYVSFAFVMCLLLTCATLFCRFCGGLDSGYRNMVSRALMKMMMSN